MDGDNDLERETNYINNLGREIQRECTAASIPVTPELVNHLIRLKLLNPRNGFTVSQIMSRELTQKFVRSCLNDLSQLDPAMDCIRLQAYWNAVLPKLDEVKVVYYSHLVEKSTVAFKDIVSSGEDDMEKIMKKIVVFINTFTNVANSNLAQNYKETMQPLRSVFKQRDYLFYESLTEEGQFEYMRFVAKIVAGIRLYQHYYKKGSENVDHAPLLLVPATSTLMNDVSNGLEKLAIRIKLLVRELYVMYDAMPGMAPFTLPDRFTMDDVAELHQIHHIMLQHEIYLKELQTYLEGFYETVQRLTANFSEAMEKLNATIGTREAIPTSEVYDQFIDICDQWSGLQAESCCLICAGLMLKNTYMINKYFPPTPLEMAAGLIESEPAIIDKREQRRRIIPDTEGYNVGLLNLTDETVLQFHGYCAWTLMVTHGALLPARTELGILKHNGNYYGFFSAGVAERWRTNAELYVRRTYEIIRRNPQLVFLLDLYDYLYDLRYEILVKDRAEIGDATDDRGIQTVLHPIPRLIDKDYSFSEWHLKTKALQLTRIVKSSTTSSQTPGHSHFRASIGVQCAPDRTHETMTMRESGAVHEAVRNYIWGLRGTPDARVQVLSLTRPVDETYERVLPTGDRPCMERCASCSGTGSMETPPRPETEMMQLIAALEFDEREFRHVMKRESETVWSDSCS